MKTVAYPAITGLLALASFASAQQSAKVYELVLAHETIGPHLRQATKSCKGLRDAAQATNAPNDSVAVTGPCGVNRGLGRVEGRGFTLDQLAGMIGSPNGFTVVNKTGLTGLFDWELKYTPDFMNQSPGRGDVDPNAPTIFTAVEQQLGLRLQLAR